MLRIHGRGLGAAARAFAAGGAADNRGPALEKVAAILGVVVALATIPLAVVGQREAALAKARAWLAPGPRCPVISRLADIGFELPALTRFDFGGAHFGRAYGNASCGRVTLDPVLGAGREPVCQFNNPTVVEVATAREHRIFVTGVLPATIVIAHGQTRCVLSARLGFDWLRP